MPVTIDQAASNIWAGGGGTDGDIVLRGPDDKSRIRLDANRANIFLGGNGATGDIMVYTESGDNETIADATVRVNGATGDIVLKNGDCAEDFVVTDVTTTEAGTVLVIGDDTRLCTSDMPYDTRVAGVVAGAGECRPGIILGRKPGRDASVPVSLVGRTFCKVDATVGSVQVGDLLTTSPLRGHAMKVTERERAFGAIIGKALARIERGTGLIPILVALQ